MPIFPSHYGPKPSFVFNIIKKHIETPTVLLLCFSISDFWILVISLQEYCYVLGKSVDDGRILTKGGKMAGERFRNLNLQIRVFSLLYCLGDMS